MQRLFYCISRNVHMSRKVYNNTNKEYWNDINKKLEKLDETVRGINHHHGPTYSYGPGMFTIAGGIFGGLWLADTFDINPFKDKN